MSIAERVAALSPGRLGVATGLVAIVGLAGVIGGLAIGSVPLMMACCAVTFFGATLLPAVADWCQATAAVEAIRRKNHEEAAMDMPGHGVETPSPSREQMLANIRACYARLEPQPGSGRFCERLSAGDEPGWDRLH
jgi:hypothetical protein